MTPPVAAFAAPETPAARAAARVRREPELVRFRCPCGRSVVAPVGSYADAAQRCHRCRRTHHDLGLVRD